ACPAAIHAQSATGRVMLGVAFDWYNVNGLRLVCVHIDRESEIGRQIAADLTPRSARIIAAHDVPVLLHKQPLWARLVHGNPVHAVADLRIWIRNVLRVQPAIDWFPCFSAIVRSKRSGCRDRDEYSLRIFRIEEDRVQTHAARSWLPFRTGVAA